MIVVDVPHCKYQIIVNCANDAMEKVLAVQYYPYIRLDIQKKDKINVYIRQFNQNIEYQVEGHEAKSVDVNGENFLVVFRRVIHSFLVAEKKYLFLHASCVVKGDSAIFIMGESMAGKSTITTYLLAKGYDYITDDFTIIDVQNGEVVPFRKAIHIRAGTHQLLKDKGFAPPAIHIDVGCGIFKRDLIFPPALTSDNRKFKILAGIVLSAYKRNHNSNDDSAMVKLEDIERKRRFVAENFISATNLLNDINCTNTLIGKIPMFYLKNRDIDYTCNNIASIFSMETAVEELDEKTKEIIGKILANKKPGFFNLLVNGSSMYPKFPVNITRISEKARLTL